MRRASSVLDACQWNAAEAVDTVLLDADERHRRRVVLKGERGAQFLLDLPQAAVLRPGDGLLLDDGSVVRVEAKPEPLFEVTAGGAADLARLAWHVGNRHAELQIVGEALRIRRDHVLESMLRGLGATIAAVEAPFEPERGAYGHGHEHGHR